MFLLFFRYFFSFLRSDPLDTAIHKQTSEVGAGKGGGKEGEPEGKKIGWWGVPGNGVCS
jgi:hypothetical protein